MPGAGCTHGPRATKKHAAEPQVQPEQPGIPRAMVLRLIRDLPGDRTFLSPSSVNRLTDLAPALGRQDHTISPSASCCSSHNTPRPSHPAPTSVTIARRPSYRRRDAREHGFDLPDGATEKFASPWHDGQFAHDAHAYHSHRVIARIRSNHWTSPVLPLDDALLRPQRAPTMWSCGYSPCERRDDGERVCARLDPVGGRRRLCRVRAHSCRSSLRAQAKQSSPSPRRQSRLLRRDAPRNDARDKAGGASGAIGFVVRRATPAPLPVIELQKRCPTGLSGEDEAFR